MTEENAIKIAKTKWWKEIDDKTIVGFQLYEEKLCMDFGNFHKAVENAMKRPIFTHEFGTFGVKAMQKNIKKISLSELLLLLPEKKRIEMEELLI